MGILDFLRRKREESEEDKVRKELLSKTYNRAYLFCGDTDKTVEINGKQISYSHSECFLVDSKHFGSVKRVIRLTGNELTGKPICVSEKECWQVGNTSGVVLHIEEGDVKYKIRDRSCLDETWTTNHNMTGVEVASRVDQYNNFEINNILKKLAEQEEIDSMFEK